jgi:3-hydroxyacyl-CoA dehydrogenase
MDLAELKGIMERRIASLEADLAGCPVVCEDCHERFVARIRKQLDSFMKAVFPVLPT